MVKALMRGVGVVVQDEATSGNGIVVAVPESLNNHRITIKGSAGVSAGAVQPESADSFDYAGTWNQVGGGPVTVVADTELELVFSGNFKFFRVPISTPIVDGTVTVIIESRP